MISEELTESLFQSTIETNKIVYQANIGLMQCQEKTMIMMLEQTNVLKRIADALEDISKTLETIN